MDALNLDYKARNEIIFGKHDDEKWIGGVRHFDNLTLSQLESLIKNNFIDLEDRQNYSPTAEEFLNFMQIHPDVTVHGYAVSHDRKDYRVSIEGLSFRGEVCDNLLFDFIHLCRLADEFVANRTELYSWWD